MKSYRVRRSYRKGLKRVEAVDRTKHSNLKTLKVCFGPCRCFSAAKR